MRLRRATGDFGKMNTVARPARLNPIALGLAALALAACTVPYGPTTIVRDRFDYVSSISDSWKQQLLLNLLKVRYFDAPVFMDVASVINSYALETGVDAGVQVSPRSRAGDTFGAIAYSGRYADRPTITYTPLSGDKFAKNLMTPLPIPGVLLLIQSGYSPDVVMRICVSVVNGLENAYGGAGSPRQGSRNFREFLNALRQSHDVGGAGLRVKTTKEKQTVVMLVPPSDDARVKVPATRMRELLKLDPTINEYAVVFGSHAENDREIAILTRSVMEILIDLASYVDVPESDYAQGRVYRPLRTGEQDELFPPLLRVRHGAMVPEDAYVAARYRGGWFWIDDRDQQSKAMFTSVLYLLSLTETGQTQAAPVVTIPAR